MNPTEKLFDNLSLRLLKSGVHSGAYNMARDLRLLKEVSEGHSPEIFCLYTWHPWCVSLGAHQKDSDIDEKACFENGFDIVRRPTGGRAVLHADEITYSAVLKITKERTSHDIYRIIHELLLKALNPLCNNALDFKKAQTDFKNVYRNSESSAVCFTSSARYEVTFQNRKVVGSAQRVFGDYVLQHGSILLGAGHERLAEVLKAPEEQRKLLKQKILTSSATLSDVAGRRILYEECATAIENVFKTI
ncbi:MAG TPA: lipoate--protein ligase family protein [Patescibacteria group bacterium]|nr:lipoate--protein ligase family protein [Patescibacteria group bacterium]